MMNFRGLIITILTGITVAVKSQAVPAVDENIPYLVTFSKDALPSWGDDDFVQIFFFVIPENYKTPFYLQIFDPDIGGSIDENDGPFDSETTFSFYGGVKCYTDKDAQSEHPKGNFKSGKMLASKVFGVNPRFDNNWQFKFGPFNPDEGEVVPNKMGRYFKIVVEGTKGNDGNLYKFFLSTDPVLQKPIEGANAFAYEYTFRMWDDPNQVSHIYPYIDDKTISIKQANFDWDDDGIIRIVSVARKGQIEKVSGENYWVDSEFKTYEEEKNTSLDIQFIKRKNPPVRNNNVAIYVTNQYGELLPFYAIPIGGVPKYKYSIGVKKK
jgi:hypothetical protein